MREGDENPTTPSNVGSRAMHTMSLCKGGEAVEQVIGAGTKASIKEMRDTKALA